MGSMLAPIQGSNYPVGWVPASQELRKGFAGGQPRAFSAPPPGSCPVGPAKVCGISLRSRRGRLPASPLEKAGQANLVPRCWLRAAGPCTGRRTLIRTQGRQASLRGEACPCVIASSAEFSGRGNLR